MKFQSRRDDESKQGNRPQFDRDGRTFGNGNNRPYLQKKQQVVKQSVEEKVEYDGPPRSVFHVNGKGDTYAEARKGTEPERAITADIFKALIQQFHEHKNINLLITEIRRVIFSPDVFARNRRLVFMIEYCVSGCIAELFEENVEFVQILGGLLKLDQEIKKREHVYYTIRELQAGRFPDKENKQVVDNLREIFCTPERNLKMLTIINGLDPHGVVVEQSDLTFGGQTVSVQKQEYVKKTSCSSRTATFADKDWARIPISLIDCIEFLKLNSFSNTEELGENLVPMNEESFIGASIKLQRAKLFESILKKSAKTTQQKKVIVEKFLPLFIDGIMESPSTNENLSAMIKLIMGMLPYHPLGCYVSHHFAFADKLNEIVINPSHQKYQIDAASYCLGEIKKTNISGLCSKLVNDFVAKGMYYGYMGFSGLHQFCYEVSSGDYIKNFSTVITNISILRDFIVSHFKSVLSTPTTTSFFTQIKAELMVCLNCVSEKISNIDGNVPRNLIDTRDNLASDIESLSKCNSDVFVKFAENAITNGVLADCAELKMEFIKNMISQIKIISEKNPANISQKTMKGFSEYAKKFEKMNSRAIEHLGQDFIVFFLDSIKDITATHANMNPLRIALIRKILTEICENISVLDGEIDTEFASEIENDFISGLILFLRKELNGYVSVLNEKITEHTLKNADITNDKKELSHHVESRRFIFDFLRTKNAIFVERFEMTLAKIKTSQIDSQGLFSLF